MIPNELKSMKPMSGKERLGAFRDSEYLGAEDIEPGTEPVLTIKSLYNGMITLARGKERHDVMVFEEETVPGMINQVRPLVVNSTNRKTLRKLFHAVSAEALIGKKIQLFLQPGVRDPSTGDKVDGIRIRDKKPSGEGAKSKPAVKCADCGKEIAGSGQFSAEQIAAGSKQKYGKCLCMECAQKAKAAMEAEVRAAQVEAADKVLKDAQNIPEEPADDLAAELMADANE